MYNSKVIERLIVKARREKWTPEKLRKEVEKYLLTLTNKRTFIEDALANLSTTYAPIDDNLKLSGLSVAEFETTAKKAGIFTENYKYFAKQKTGVRNDIIKIFTENANDKDATEKDLRNNIRSVMQKYKNSAKSIANTALMQLSRYQNIEQMKADGVKYFKYNGPTPQRPFCKEWFNKTISLEELEKLQNDFGNPAAVDGGGWNCRHRWDAIITNDD